MRIQDLYADLSVTFVRKEGLSYVVEFPQADGKRTNKALIYGGSEVREVIAFSVFDNSPDWERAEAPSE